jgi:leucyl aminopeptidase (aminopeptidase T)
VPDPRLESLASVICSYSLDVQPGDVVRVTGPASADAFFAAVTRHITRLGGHPMLRASLPAVEAARLRAAGQDAHHLGRRQHPLPERDGA